MTDPPSPPSANSTSLVTHSSITITRSSIGEDPNPTTGGIPVEFISEEEMALIEAALSAAATAARPSICCASSSSSYSILARSVESVSAFAKRSLPSLSCSKFEHHTDIEESGRSRSAREKKIRVRESLLSRFRRRTGLYVTDITATEWCEKQMEFLLLLGRPEITNAMKTGKIRHAKLEEEIVKKVKVPVKSSEDVWALKFMNFIIGANQLLFDGLTRELPVIGFVEGVWMVGVIDELRLPLAGANRNPVLVDTKTREKATLPAKPQQRNGRLQLMCYKYLWDNLVVNDFPSKQFFDWFSLDANYILSEEIKMITSESGFQTETLDELVKYFGNACKVLAPADDQLLLRYELQQDNSLLGEDQFTYDIGWLKTKLQHSLRFWQGERDPSYVTEEENWKCRFCQFASVCPARIDSHIASSSHHS